MIETSRDLVVPVDPEQVWRLLADFAGIAVWAPNVDHSCLTTSLSEGVGAQRRVQVGRNVLLERIVTWEPGRCLSYLLEGLPAVLRSVTNTWTLAQQGDSTHVTLTTAIEHGPKPPHRVAARAASRLLSKASGELLAGLDAHLRGSSVEVGA